VIKDSSPLELMLKRLSSSPEDSAKVRLSFSESVPAIVATAVPPSNNVIAPGSVRIGAVFGFGAGVGSPPPPPPPPQAVRLAAQTRTSTLF
jgi:hypothetical protein